MPQPTKKTAKRLARIAELHAAGRSSRQIAKGEGISHETVCKWVEELGLKVKKGEPRSPAELAAEKRRAKVAEIVTAAARDVARDGESPTLASLRRRHAQISASIDVVFHDVASGDMPPNTLSALTKFEVEYATAIRTLEVQERRAGEGDASSRASGKRFTAKLEQLVAAEWPKLRCVHCHKHPYE